MRRLTSALAALALSLGALPAARAASVSAPQALAVTSGGAVQARTYVYYKPDGFDPSKGMLIVLHGGGGTGELAAGAASDHLFTQLADRVGVLVVFPDGIAGGWNSCSSSPSDSQGARPDDVAFIRALIPRMQQQVTTPAGAGIDPARVYVAGHSEGSKMAERLALEANDVIAAAAVIAGNLPVANDNTPDHGFKCKGYDQPWGGAGGRVVPMFLFKGDMDPRIPFGDISEADPAHPDVAEDHLTYCQVKDSDPATCKTGLQHSYYETVAFWQWKLGVSGSKTDAVSPNPLVVSTGSRIAYEDAVPMCPAAYPAQDQVPGCGRKPKGAEPSAADFAAADGSSVIRYTYGEAPFRLVFDRVRGGGHCFPGPSAQVLTAAQALATGHCAFQASGWKNRDPLLSDDRRPYIAETMWAFFDQFSLKD